MAYQGKGKVLKVIRVVEELTMLWPFTWLIVAGTVYVMTGGLLGTAAQLVAGRFSAGYRPGEGPLTPLVFGNGLLVTEDSPHDAGRFLYGLGDREEVLQAFRGKRLRLTISEGETLYALLAPFEDIIGMGAKAAGKLELLEAGVAASSPEEQEAYLAGMKEVLEEIGNLRATQGKLTVSVLQFLSGIHESRLGV